MTATPKHRLRATVTYTVEYDPCPKHAAANDPRGCGDYDRKLLENDYPIEGLGEPTRTMKVEVIRPVGTETGFTHALRRPGR